MVQREQEPGVNLEKISVFCSPRLQYSNLDNPVVEFVITKDLGGLKATIKAAVNYPFNENKRDQETDFNTFLYSQPKDGIKMVSTLRATKAAMEVWEIDRQKLK